MPSSEQRQLKKRNSKKGGRKQKPKIKTKSKLKDLVLTPETGEKYSVVVSKKDNSNSKSKNSKSQKKTSIIKDVFIEKNKPTRIDIIKGESRSYSKNKTVDNPEYTNIDISKVIKYTPTYLHKITNPKEKKVINEFYKRLRSVNDVIIDIEKDIIQDKASRDIINKDIKDIKDEIKWIETFIKEVENRKTFFGYIKKQKELRDVNIILNNQKKTLDKLQKESKRLKKKMEESSHSIDNLIKKTLSTY